MTETDWRVPEVGDVFENPWGERFKVARVEPLPAEQGYVVGHWNYGSYDEMRFATINSGTMRLVARAR